MHFNHEMEEVYWALNFLPFGCPLAQKVQPLASFWSLFRHALVAGLWPVKEMTSFLHPGIIGFMQLPYLPAQCGSMNVSSQSLLTPGEHFLPAKEHCIRCRVGLMWVQA